MAWYDKAVIYHIYPLGLCGCPHTNNGESANHFKKLNDWATHAAKLGFSCIYIGPLFESEGHGYETTDYRMVDRRLGTNEDFKNFVKHCHDMGVKVIVDGVFNHTGRTFFAFDDLRKNREGSRYRDWYCNVNFWGNTEYNDGFSYDNWGGYNLLAKLNMHNPEVRSYHFDTVRMWVNEFDIDGIRLDAADVLDHNFMRELRGVTDGLKADFWLMGEVIHGDYSRWANGDMLHSVTNYELHKGLYSGHNDHNYFEIAHSVKRLLGICGKTRLYTFVDNHDVERIHTKLNNKAHLMNVMLLDYTLPGIPSVYYGSEYGIDGKKGGGDDWVLRPCLELADFDDNDALPALIKRLGELKRDYPELTDGEYKELTLTTGQYSYARILNGKAVITALNNSDSPAHMEIPLPVNASVAIDLLEKKEEEPVEELVEEEVIEEVVEEEAVEEKPEDNKTFKMSVEESAALAFDAAELADMLKKANRAMERNSPEAEDILRRACAKYFVLDNALRTACKDIKPYEESANVQSAAPVQNVSFDAAASSYAVRDGRLIVDLAPNSGSVVYVK